MANISPVSGNMATGGDGGTGGGDGGEGGNGGGAFGGGAFLGDASAATMTAEFTTSSINNNAATGGNGGDGGAGDFTKGGNGGRANGGGAYVGLGDLTLITSSVFESSTKTISNLKCISFPPRSLCSIARHSFVRSRAQR